MDLGTIIDRAVEALSDPALQVETGPMSTLVVGETDAVFAGLRRAFQIAAEEGHVVMTVTLSNACPV